MKNRKQVCVSPLLEVCSNVHACTHQVVFFVCVEFIRLWVKLDNTVILRAPSIWTDMYIVESFPLSLVGWPVAIRRGSPRPCPSSSSRTIQLLPDDGDVRHEIFQIFYMNEFSGQKFYTLITGTSWYPMQWNELAVVVGRGALAGPRQS